MTFYSDAWASSVAQAFINGYSDGHSGVTSYIDIGVSNDDDNWACSSGNWSSAGTAWGQLVNALTPRSNVVVQGADDFEVWWDSQDNWGACGAGAVAWLNAYTAATTDFMDDFGSDGNAENSSLWSVAQVYDVSWGIGAAVPLPEIYCSGQQQEWVGIRRYGTMTFFGVSSENGAYFGNGCNGSSYTNTYTWQQSWNNLNNSLTSAGYSNDLYSVATIF
ncbi:MAG TPA: hypothetical protein VF763_00720 [Candidatus Limnocylindrales bacterium]